MAESEAGKHKDEDDMARAIKMSQDEDERRKAELARNPNSGLFDEQQRDPNQLIDLDSSVQPQPTGMVPQFTGMPSQQFSSYNPFAAQQQAAQEEYMRMLDMQQQQQQQEQQQQYQQMLQQQQQQQMFQQQQFLMSQPTAQPLVPQPTAFGSNNPFAAFSQPSLSASATPVQQQPSPQPQPSLPRPASQPNINSAQPNINSSQPFPKRNNEHDEKHKELAAMLGSGGSGIDTYGNVGNMRIPM